MPSITPNMELVMQFLQGWPGNEFKQAEITKQIGMRPHVIGAMLSSLVMQSEIKRRQDEKTHDIFFHYPKPIEKGSIAGSRTTEFKPLGIYNMKSHMEACEGMRTIENGGLV